MTDYFNRMIKVCNKKCVVKFNEPDLQVGEMSCVDRCVGKYMQAQEKVGEVLQNFEKQMQAQEKAQQAAAVQFGSRGPK
jgi:import inner membrane translocase subunit TIM10